MKKQLHTLLFILGTTISSFAQTSACLLDSSYHQYAGSTVDYRRYLTYDSDDRMIVELRKEFIDNQWIPVDKKEFTFDANGNQTQMVHSKIDLSTNSLAFFERESNTFNASNYRTLKLNERFNNGEWQPSNRIYYTPALSGKDSIAVKHVWLSEINDFQRYDSTVYSWINTEHPIRINIYGYSNNDNIYSESSREEFGYFTTEQNILLVANHKLYNRSMGNFRVVSEMMNNYSSSGLILSSQHYQYAINLTQPVIASTYTYDSSDRLIEETNSSYNPMSNGPTPNSRKVYSYNEDNNVKEERRLTFIQQQGFILSAIDSLTYNENGRVSTIMTYGITNNSPNDNNSLRTYTYNNDDQLIQLKVENYTGQTPGSLVSQQDYFYCVEPELSITDVALNTLTVYPNPVLNTVNLVVPSNGMATLYTTTGKVILVFDMIQGENTIDMQQFEPGMYILKMDNGLDAKIVKQ